MNWENINVFVREKLASSGLCNLYLFHIYGVQSGFGSVWTSDRTVFFVQQVRPENARTHPAFSSCTRQLEER